MASIVGICNSALVKLGATRIISLTEGSKNANLCSEQYPKIRDDLLRAHAWNFAIARAQLAQSASSPTFGWDYAYPVPSDFLRVISVHDNDEGVGTIPYKIEGRQILTDATTVYLRYIKRVTDPNTMDAAFQECLAWALATDLAIPVTSQNSMQQQMFEGLTIQLARAKSVDAIEDFPEQEPDGSWVEERN